MLKRLCRKHVARGGSLIGLVLIGILLLAAPAAAQEVPESDGEQRGRDDRPAMLATFGWSGQIPANRWGPITIHISNVKAPIGGVVLLEYAQDETQSARVQIPFAATPGLPTRVQAVAAIPSNILQVRISLIGENGRLLRSMTYSARGALRLPPFIEPDHQTLVVGIGRVGATDALNQWNKATTDARVGSLAARNASDVAWRNAALARCEVTDMPLSYKAYDAVTVLAVNADVAGEADPRAIAAVRQWVQGGGRLALVVTAPGESWRAWFPEGQAPPVELDSLRAGPLPREVGGTIAKFDSVLRTMGEEDRAGRADPLPALATSLPMRRIRLTSQARAGGLWRTRWSLPEEGEHPSSLLAEGPVGLGWVTVLGMDPARATETLSGRAAGAVWRDAVESASDDAARVIGEGPTVRFGWTPSQAAIAAAIARVGNVPVVGDFIFVLIALCVLGLALMVGPVDYLVLKRLRLTQRSWLTALAWIALAGLSAYTLPRVVRKDPTQVNRIAVIDAVGEVPDSVTGASSFGVGHYTAVTGIYAAQSGTTEFAGTIPTSWWRGVASSSPWRERRPGGAAVLPVVQAAAGGEAGSARGSPVVGMPLQLWTFRTMMDEGEILLPLSVMLRERDGARVATIVGLPEGAFVTAAVLRTENRWHPLREQVSPPSPDRGQRGFREHVEPYRELREPVGEHEGTSWTGVFVRAGVTKTPAAWDRVEGEISYWSVDQTDNPGPLHLLPGSGARLATIDRHVRSGRWAAIYLKVDGWPTGPTISWNARYTTTYILRLVVPLQAIEQTPDEEGP